MPPWPAAASGDRHWAAHEDRDPWPSPVARAAVDELGRLDVVAGHHSPSEVLVTFGMAVPVAPVHARHLIAWPQARRGIAVTVQAPSHLERLGTGQQRHVVDPPVTGDAGHAAGNVDGMIEVD